jgi:F-type H+-transporting ATPase subunit b
MQNLQADNQRILQEARMERDNMLKMHVKLKKKNDCWFKTEAQAQGLKWLTSKSSNESEKKMQYGWIETQVSTLSLSCRKIIERQI